MNCKWLRSGFLSQYRIEIIMWVLVVEILASPLADTHPHAGALLGLAVLCIVVSAIRHVADRAIVAVSCFPWRGSGWSHESERLSETATNCTRISLRLWA